MSGFSDKHLEVVKKHVALTDDLGLKRLILRLEAAEAVCEYFYHMPDKEEIWPYAEAKLEAWLLSKGGAGK